MEKQGNVETHDCFDADAQSIRSDDDGGILGSDVFTGCQHIFLPCLLLRVPKSLQSVLLEFEFWSI